MNVIGYSLLVIWSPITDYYPLVTVVVGWVKRKRVTQQNPFCCWVSRGDVPWNVSTQPTGLIGVGFRYSPPNLHFCPLFSND